MDPPYDGHGIVPLRPGRFLPGGLFGRADILGSD
jgi:hypothetical protein